MLTLIVAILLLSDGSPAVDVSHSVPKARWSKEGWRTLKWRMGTADAVKALATQGVAWRPTSEEKMMYGQATEIAYAALLKEPIADLSAFAVLKFSRQELFGVQLILSADGKGLPVEACDARLALLKKTLIRKYGAPSNDKPSILTGAPRARWDSPTLKLLLAENRNDHGCFVHLTYSDPQFEYVMDPAAMDRQLREWGAKGKGRGGQALALCVSLASSGAGLWKPER